MYGHLKNTTDRNSQAVIEIASYMDFLDHVSTQNCDFILIPLNIKNYRAFMLSPKMPDLANIMKKLNKAISENFQRITVIMERYIMRKRREYEICRRRLFMKHAKPVGHPIGMWRLGEAFILLGYGLALCVAIFVVECWLSSQIYISSHCRYVPRCFWL